MLFFGHGGSGKRVLLLNAVEVLQQPLCGETQAVGVAHRKRLEAELSRAPCVCGKLALQKLLTAEQVGDGFDGLHLMPLIGRVLEL